MSESFSPLSPHLFFTEFSAVTGPVFGSLALEGAQLINIHHPLTI